MSDQTTKTVTLPGIGRVTVDLDSGELSVPNGRPRTAHLMGIGVGAATTEELEAQRRRQDAARKMAGL